jgi:hypothetical protein
MTNLILMTQYTMMYEVPYGALTQLWGGTSEEGKDFNGKVSFYISISPAVVRPD